jgi:Flp pilus assembly protein TadG
MGLRAHFDSQRQREGESGGIAVELAIFLPVLLLLILGGMDLGHRYYIQNLTSNASREGARYAANYTGTNSYPTSAAISSYVTSSAGLGYGGLNLSNLVVTGAYTGTSPNKIVVVTVRADKQWWILGNLPGFTNPNTVTATTAMRVEH